MAFGWTNSEPALAGLSGTVEDPLARYETFTALLEASPFGAAAFGWGPAGRPVDPPWLVGTTSAFGDHGGR